MVIALSNLKAFAVAGLICLLGAGVLMTPQVALAALASDQQAALDAAAGDAEALATVAAALALANPEAAADIAKAASDLNPGAALRIAVAVVRAVPDSAINVAQLVAPIAGSENAAALAAALSTLAPVNAPDIAAVVAAVFPPQAAAIISAIVDLNGAAVDRGQMIDAVAASTGLDKPELTNRVVAHDPAASVIQARTALDEGNVSFLAAMKIEGVDGATATVPDSGSELEDQGSVN